MAKLSQVRYIVAALLALCAAGCATDSSKLLAFDQSRDRLVLVVGHFAGMSWLDAAPPCDSPGGDPDHEWIVDCVHVPPVITTLNVDEVVYGDYPGPKLRVIHYTAQLKSRVPPGEGKPMLALLHTDGEHFVTSELRRLAQTTRGEWALPVERDEMLDILPCGAEPLVKAIQFAHPLPGDSLEGYDADVIEELKQNPRVKVGSGRYTITHGVLLDDIKKFMAAQAPANPAEYKCRYYGVPAPKFTIQGLE